MDKKLFLLDGMALVYRAHFAFIARPITTSKGANTSALFGFTQTLLDILQNQRPTHLAVVFDTEAPTQRHKDFAEYKAHREAMPEELSAALPHVRRMIEAFNVRVLACDGWEADDVIGTLARRAAREDFTSFMVTPDKDFGQLVSGRIFQFRPSRSGDGAEILGVPEVLAKWQIERTDQVIDLLGLMGDASDNIPGVPGIGEKTASKLIAQFGSIENLLAHLGELKGKQRETLEKHREQALLSKRLATIDCAAPCEIDLEELRVGQPNDEQLRALCVEFEFNTIGRRLFGDEFKAGRGFEPSSGASSKSGKSKVDEGQNLLPGLETEPEAVEQPVVRANLKTIADVPHEYVIVSTPEQRAELIERLRGLKSFCFDTETTELDPKEARLVGMSFAFEPHRAFYVPLKTPAPNLPSAGSGTLTPSLSHPMGEGEPEAAFTAIGTIHTPNEGMPQARGRDLACVKEGVRFSTQDGQMFPPLPFGKGEGRGEGSPLDDQASEVRRILEEFRPLFEDDAVEIVGHNLKFDLSVLQAHGVTVRTRLFDTMIAHSLVEPDLRHGMDFLSEVLLGYTPIPITKLIGDKKGEQLSMAAVPLEQIAEYAAEDADVTWRLRGALEPALRRKKQERVFYEIESPLIPVLADMELEGIRIDAAVLADIRAQMAKDMDGLQAKVWSLAGEEFNLNSTRQLGAVLFERLKISDAPKKTKTGLYATDEQTLLLLAADHEIVQRLLEYRELTKLKSTYVDALPAAISPRTGRVHTNYQQAITATGRLNSQNPNLQNIPIRTEQGKEIRKAFVPRDNNYVLLSADYSQIELRIIAALSREAGLLGAFHSDRDVHTATAARVFGVALDAVTSDMRRKAKMVNYGIAYGISSFGLAQRLGIPRKEGAAIIEQYFAQFPGIRRYMDETIAFARQHGFTETVTGRRRYLRDIRSANATIRAAAERNAINAPIQGTAADMIKLAMVNIHREMTRRKLRTRMLLQVHDELVFDLHTSEENEVLPLVKEKMQTALPLEVPIVVELGIGANWLEAH